MISLACEPQSRYAGLTIRFCFLLYVLRLVRAN